MYFPKQKNRRIPSVPRDDKLIDMINVIRLYNTNSMMILIIAKHTHRPSYIPILKTCIWVIGGEDIEYYILQITYWVVLEIPNLLFSHQQYKYSDISKLCKSQATTWSIYHYRIWTKNIYYIIDIDTIYIIDTKGYHLDIQQTILITKS